MHIVIVAIGHAVCIEPLPCSLGPRGRTTILCELAFPSSHRNRKLLIVEVGATSMFAPLLPAFAEDRNATDLYAFVLVQLQHRLHMRRFGGPLHIDAFIWVIDRPVLLLCLSIYHSVLGQARGPIAADALAANQEWTDLPS